MKNLLAMMLLLAVVSPAFSQKDKPKAKKKDEKKHTLTIGFTLGAGPFLKLQTKAENAKENRETRAVIDAITSALSTNHKPKKMVQVHRIVVPSPLSFLHQIIKPVVATAASKTASECPYCHRTTSTKIQKVVFDKALPTAAIQIRTKITETDNNGKKNVLATPKIAAMPGQKACLEVTSASDGFKLEIVAKPMPHHPGFIMVSPVLYKMNKDGKMKLVTKPTIMTKNGIPSKVMVGSQHHKNIEMEIVANRIFPHPMPAAAMKMMSPNVVFGMTHPIAMPHPPIAMTAPAQMPSAMMPAMAQTMMPTHLCESCRMAAMRKCAHCGKPLASQATMPNIMQAGFAHVNNNQMTVKVYPILKDAGLTSILSDLFESDETRAKKLMDELVKTIKMSISPDSWNENGGEASISFSWLGGCFVVRQNAQGHQELEKLLHDMSQSMKETLKDINEKKDKP